MEIKEVLAKINDMRINWYQPPCTYDQKRIDFEYQSYRSSALNEVKFYLLDHQNQDPITAIEDFRNQMDDFACTTNNGESSFMFSIYYDVATDVLDALITAE